ncbi:hypothetical protein SH501x_001368 [Pirellulaceae bacterium SH501]
MQPSACKRHPLWQTISRIPSLKAPRFLWEAELGELWSECQSLLTPTSELATWTFASDGVMVCDVVQHGDGTFTGIDYENGDSFDVERESLLVCKLNLRKLAERITESLGGRIDFQAPDPSDKTHRIGRLPPKLASAPLYLCVRTKQDALLAACASLAGATSTVILVPTLSHTSIDVDALADQFRTLLVAMDDLLLTSVNGWECDPYVLEELRNRLGVGDCTHANSFKLVGESYQISFQGKPITLPNSVGLWYLREFLSHPHQTFDPIDLESVRTGVNGRSSTSSTGESFDAEARKQYAQKLADLEEEITEASEFHDWGRLEKLQTDRQAILDHVTKASRKGGKARVTTDASRARKNIRQQVKREIERIEGSSPELAEHLRIAFQGDPMCYRPTTDPQWQF